MFAIFGALFVRGRRANAQGSSSVGLIAAAVLVIAVQEFFVSSYSANTLIGIPVLLCLGTALMLNRDLTLRLSRGRKIRFGFWCATVTSIGVAGTVAAVHRGRARAPDTPWTDYLRGWELVCIVLLLLVAIFGGFWVFRKSTAWDQVLAWSVVGGMLPFLAVGPTLLLMGETKVTGVVGSCIGAHHTCAAFGEVAGFVVIASPISVAAAFLAAFGVKWLIGRGRGELPAPTA